MPDTDPEYLARKREKNLRSEALIVLSNLEQNPAETMNGLHGVNAALGEAWRRLSAARIMASNGAAPEPDSEAGLWCGWCGSTAKLSNDGAPGCQDEWFCADPKACQQRRAARYPDKITEEVRLARAEVAYWADAAEAGTIALTAYSAAHKGWSREQLLRLASGQKLPQKLSQARPAPSRQRYLKTEWMVTAPVPVG
jgi:hypothetical protein